MDWSKIKHFSADEFKCKHSFEEHMRFEFVKELDKLRKLYGKPLVVNSGWRHPTKHPIEARKRHPGAHSKGLAVDFKIDRADAHRLLHLACGMGVFTGIGVSQKGSRGRFLHLDMAEARDLVGTIRPTIWSY